MRAAQCPTASVVRVTGQLTPTRPRTSWRTFTKPRIRRTRGKPPSTRDWRALGAVGKADHVIALCARARPRARRARWRSAAATARCCASCTRRGFGGRLAGVEITEAAVADRPRARADRLRGAAMTARTCRIADGAYELGILSHVLEHVPDPPALLAEVARVCAAVVVEVPLEANMSARRAGKREHAAEVGHLQRLDRAGGGRSWPSRAADRRRARGPAAAGGPPLLRRRPRARAGRARSGRCERALHRARAVARAAAVHRPLRVSVPCRRARSGREQQRQHPCPSARREPPRGRRASGARCRRRARRSRPRAAPPGAPARGRTRARRRRSAASAAWRTCAKRAATFGRTSASRTP